MRIGDRDIGVGHPVFVIAEIGVNHDGSVARAIELVHAAKSAGADAVKLQVFRADTLVHRSAEFAEYQKDRVAAADPAEMLRQYELDDDALAAIARAVAAAGLLLVSTPFSKADVPRATAVSATLKIASPDLVNRLLLSAAVETALPLIVSTGAATAVEIADAAAWLDARHCDFALLHCVSNYPVDDDDAHLAWIGDLRRFGRPVGYSDHATAADAAALAVACGACLVEKHLTYDTAAIGPDHAASLEPAGFAEYVRSIRRAERLLGRAGRIVLPCEADVRRVSRQSLVAVRALAAGQRLTPDDLTTQRPGTGVSAVEYEAVLGQCVTRAIAAGDMLRAGDVTRAS